MPIIKGDESTKSDRSAPGLDVRFLVGAGEGSTNLSVEEVAIAPRTRMPRHIHTNSEEAMVVLDGTLHVTLDGQRSVVGPGDAVLAPAGAEHGLVNRSDKPARLLFIFPILNPDKVLSRVAGAPVGFESERGLTGYTSPSDRPLDKKG